MGLTIEDIQKAKSNAEQTILYAISQFENNTGLSIDRVVLTRTLQVGLPSRVVEVKLEVPL